MGWGMLTVDLQVNSVLVALPVAGPLADLGAPRGNHGAADVQDAMGGEGGDAPQVGVQPLPLHRAPRAGQGAVQLRRAPEPHHRLLRCHCQLVSGSSWMEEGGNRGV